MKLLKGLVLLLCIISLASCAYHFQGRNNPLQKMGVEKIYITSFKNRTFRPGIEQLFTTAMIREVQKSRSFKLVNSEAEADAVLSGEVKAADMGSPNLKGVDLSVDPEVKTIVDVGAEFTASVTCDVQLTDKYKRVLFAHSETGTKIFPGATNLGDAGATNSLINDSEQRLAIQFLASQMMASTYQRIIDIF